MDGQKITAEQIKALLCGDIDLLAQKIAAAMNGAKAGSIIADSEEPVRDAHAEFRQQSFQRALSLLAQQQGKEAFSPSAYDGSPLEEQGQTVRHTRDRQR
jgi:hypothetical protein